MGTRVIYDGVGVLNVEVEVVGTGETDGNVAGVIGSEENSRSYALSGNIACRYD